MEKPRAIVTVINDLYSDRRVDKTCQELVNHGFEVTLLGRLLPGSPDLDNRPYYTHRFSMIFRSGIFMYVEIQIRLFIWLLTHKAHLFWSNDLDTLLPCLLVAKMRNAPVIQDSHEYFTGVPELVANPGKQKIWKSLERFSYPRVDELITVNESIANLFRQEYNREVHVIRNVPRKLTFSNLKSRYELGIPEDKSILLLQGAGINMERGAEELIMAIDLLDNVMLYIIGSGDIIPELKKMVSDMHLGDKVGFKDRMPWNLLMQYTMHADIGFSLDKPLSLNYRYSLPNKLFDYIQAKTPVIVSDIVEVKKIVEEYDIGLVVNGHNPESISKAIRSALDDKARYQKWKENLKFAAAILNWEKENTILHGILHKYA